MKKKGLVGSFAIFIMFILVVFAVINPDSETVENKGNTVTETTTYDYVFDSNIALADKSTSSEVTVSSSQPENIYPEIPEYSGKRVEIINGDVPFFTDEEKVYKGTYIYLSELDEYGRCGVANSCVGLETRTAEKRGSISSIYPSGWKQLKLSNGGYLYNRSHLLMYALTGINADKRNLITGTQQFNASTKYGMLAYETQVLWVVDNYNAHVLYRVTPYFDGNNLVAKGVLMEAYCIEYPEECEFCVFIYNVQDGVEINYATGEAHEPANNQTEESYAYSNAEPTTSKNPVAVPQSPETGTVMVWIPVNGGTKYHKKQTCSNMKDPMQVSMEQAIDSGYEPCKKCYK